MFVITGGAGFIGSAIVWKLNTLGHKDIIIVDEGKSVSENKKRNLAPLSFDNYIDKIEFLEKIRGNKIKDIKAIFHMGANSSTTEKNRDSIIENNFEYTKNLAEWSVKNNVRFIYASTAATYGDGSRGFSDDEKVIPELKPMNYYAESKQMFDMHALKNNLFKKIVGLKYFNVFGPNEYHKGDMRSVVLKSYQQIIKEGKVKLFKSYNSKYPDGGQVRDFVYVKDAVDMTFFFFEHPEINGIFNVGSGAARTWNDLIKAVFNALNKEPVIKYVDMPESIRDKYQYHTQAELNKLRKSGYKKNITSLEGGVRDYVVNYLVPDKCLEKGDSVRS